MGYHPDQTLYEVLFETRDAKGFRWPDPVARGAPNATVEAARIGWFPEKALFEEYARFGRGHGHDLAPFDVYLRDDVHGLRWPVVGGKETRWRFNEEHDPYARRGSGIDFYGKAMKRLPEGTLAGPGKGEKVPLPGKAKIFFRPYAPPPEVPDATFDRCRATGRRSRRGPRAAARKDGRRSSPCPAAAPSPPCPARRASPPGASSWPCRRSRSRCRGARRDRAPR